MLVHLCFTSETSCGLQGSPSPFEAVGRVVPSPAANGLIAFRAAPYPPASGECVGIGVKQLPGPLWGDRPPIQHQQRSHLDDVRHRIHRLAAISVPRRLESSPIVFVLSPRKQTDRCIHVLQRHGSRVMDRSGKKDSSLTKERMSRQHFGVLNHGTSLYFCSFPNSWECKMGRSCPYSLGEGVVQIAPERSLSLEAPSWKLLLKWRDLLNSGERLVGQRNTVRCGFLHSLTLKSVHTTQFREWTATIAQILRGYSLLTKEALWERQLLLRRRVSSYTTSQTDSRFWTAST
eukprot:gene4792-3437_t